MACTVEVPDDRRIKNVVLEQTELTPDYGLSLKLELWIR